jgi:hypothetical protein
MEAVIKIDNMPDIVNYIMNKMEYYDLKLNYYIYSKEGAHLFKDNIAIAITANYDLHKLNISSYGKESDIEYYKKFFNEIFNNFNSEIKLSWYYSNGKGYDSADISIETNVNAVKDSHYPFLKDGMNKFLENYHTSNSSILLLAGDPGSGKTSLIRHYISKYRLNSMVTYDESIMMRDDFYINFLTSSKKHVLIVEDADLLLSKRDNADNKIMSKFLNVSDGLVKGSNKKIIFSTNITQLNKIDPAIIRKGRCFDVVEFRKLTKNEANAVCRDHELSELSIDKEYNLTEIFNRNTLSAIPKAIGF